MIAIIATILAIMILIRINDYESGLTVYEFSLFVLLMDRFSNPKHIDV